MGVCSRRSARRKAISCTATDCTNIIKDAVARHALHALVGAPSYRAFDYQGVKRVVLPTTSTSPSGLIWKGQTLFIKANLIRIVENPVEEKLYVFNKFLDRSF